MQRDLTSLITVRRPRFLIVNDHEQDLRTYSGSQPFHHSCLSFASVTRLGRAMFSYVGLYERVQYGLLGTREFNVIDSRRAHPWSLLPAELTTDSAQIDTGRQEAVAADGR